MTETRSKTRTGEDPIGDAMDALARHVAAQRWLFAARTADGWTTHARERSHRDDVLLRVAESLVGESGAHLLATPDLGNDGLRLHSAGVDRLLALVSSSGQESVVSLFENPDPDRASSFVNSQLGAALAAMGNLEHRILRLSWKGAELRRLAAWVPRLDSYARGEIDDSTALVALAEGTGCRALLTLRHAGEKAEASGVWAHPDGWRDGTSRIVGSGPSADPLAAASRAAQDMGMPAAVDWRIGSAEGLSLAVAGGRVSSEGLDVAARLLASASKRARDAAATRNNALLQERARIAGVMHEGITQVLTNVAIQMEVLDRLVDDPEAARKMVRSLRAAVLEALDSLRGAILELTPNAPEWTDLAQGLERFVGDFGSQWGLDFSFAVAGSAREVDPDILALAFAFVQEGLSNVRKHAGTTEAAVNLTFEPAGVTIEVSDEGDGFDPARGNEDGFRLHQGLQIIRSRIRLAGGRLQVRSSPGRGTTMRLEIEA